MAISNDDLLIHIGKLERAQTETDRRLERIEGKTDSINRTLSELEGGRRTALWLLAAFGTVAGSVGGFLTWVWSRL